MNQLIKQQGGEVWEARLPPSLLGKSSETQRLYPPAVKERTLDSGMDDCVSERMLQTGPVGVGMLCERPRRTADNILLLTWVGHSGRPALPE